MTLPTTSNDKRFHAAQKDAFARAVRENRLSHAYIVEGGEGFGKKTFALYAAASILCQAQNAPCGECAVCRKVFSGAHPDVSLYAPEKDTAFSVSAVRSIKSSIYLAPGESEKRIYILAEAQTMTPQAQNALLKFFEEPPASAVFFILTEKRESLLPTVVSRGSIITLSPVPDAEILAYLRALYPRTPLPDLEAAARMACGSVGAAMTLADKQSGVLRKAVFDFLPALFGSSAFEIASNLQALPRNREQIRRFLLMTLDALGDLAKWKYGNGDLIFFTAAEATGFAQRVTARKCVRLYDAVSEAYLSLGKNTNISLTLTRLAAQTETVCGR